MAVLAKGRILFQGSPTELTGGAEGRVWTVTTDSPRKPNNGLTVVSMLHLTDGVQYRLVGPNAEEYPEAKAAQPGLEDGYVWLMKSAGHEALV
jgi:hypothetical protein